jgi:hypothetical protein
MPIDKFLKYTICEKQQVPTLCDLVRSKIFKYCSFVPTQFSIHTYYLLLNILVKLLLTKALEFLIEATLAQLTFIRSKPSTSDFRW